MSRQSSLRLSAVLLICATISVFGLSSRAQKDGKNQGSREIKLKYAAELLIEDSNDIPPIPISSNRLLVTVGDTIYLLDGKSQVVWDYSFGGNNITDVMVDPKGVIYASILDGLLIAIDSSGKKVWSHFLNGSGNYVQLASYKDGGVLVVVDMSAYRERFDTEDKLQYWKNQEFVWSKEFPRGAKLHVWGDKILAVAQSKEGKVIREIR